MKQVLFTLLLVVVLISCGGPEARRPVQAKTASFMKESIDRNKALLQNEEAAIKALIVQDSANTYLSTANGLWYKYEEKATATGYKPQAGDEVQLSYNLISLSRDTIYRMTDVGVIDYKVDKQENLPPGLRAAVKLLQQGETATFMIPSAMGYGYHGDNKDIGPNVPLMSTIHIVNITKDTITTNP